MSTRALTVEARPQSVITLQASERMHRERMRDLPQFQARGQPWGEQIRREICLYEDARIFAAIDHELYGRPGIVLGQGTPP
jgi:hypothetical protein